MLAASLTLLVAGGTSAAQGPAQGGAERLAGRTVVACQKNLQSNRLNFKAHPDNCNFAKRGETYPSTTDGRSLDWRNWGGTRAYAEGRTVVNSVGFTELKVRLSRPVRKCGHRVYSKIRVSYPEFGSGGSYKLDVCKR